MTKAEQAAIVDSVVSRLTRTAADVSKCLHEQSIAMVESRIAEAIDSHRRAVWVRDQWCCKEMETFASHFWGASKPMREGEFWAAYKIRNAHVNYCPFCGVFVGRKDT
jgi:hypothetical protein